MPYKLLLCVMIFMITRLDVLALGSPDSLLIEQITVSGNTRTQESIILRELLFEKGQYVDSSAFGALLEASRTNLIKTSLFHTVIIDTSVNHDHVTVHVGVTERWYVWVWPLLEHPDRNFNDWWQHHDLTRLSAGLHFQHENARGRMEKIHIMALTGYRNLLVLSWEFPYINKSKTLGASIATTLSSQHELNYATGNNRQLFYHGDDFMLHGANLALTARYRPGTFITHFVTLKFTSLHFNDTLNLLNADYLNSVDNNPQYMEAGYLLKIDLRDNRAYPLKGFYAETELTHLLLLKEKYNQTIWGTSLRGFLPMDRKWYAASEFAIKLTTPVTKPYYLQNALGFDRDFVRGYEYLVIEGAHYWLFKSQIRYALVPGFTLKIPFIKSEKFNTIPISIYTGPHFDAGKVWPSTNPSVNSLQGTILAGYGLGIDLVTYYDKVLRCEYTFRHQGASGLFIHFMATI